MVLVLAVAAVPAVVFLPPFIAPELDDPRAQFEVLDRARLTVAAVIGGLGVLAGAYINWLRVTALERQVETAQLGQITERFTRAIDQLGAVRPDNTAATQIRAGGVRSLERIARESCDDFWPILDILTAYLRSQSPTAPHEWEDAEPWWERAYEKRVRMDVAFTIEAIQRLWPDSRRLPGVLPSLAFTFAPRLALRGKNLAGANLQGAFLREADLAMADLTGANLPGSHLPHANLEETNLEQANLRGANLEGANLSFADLRRAILRGANLARADLPNASLRNANLEDANLRGANLASAELGNANLRGANLDGADLPNARLVAAHLVDADLRNAILHGADLRSANLRGARLAGADLRDTDLATTGLRGITHDRTTRWPNGFTPPATVA